MGDDVSIRRYLWPQRWGITVLLVLLVTSTGIGLARPILLGRFIDQAVAGGASTTLRGTAIAYLVLGLVNQGVSVVDVYLAEHLGLLATNRLRHDLTRHCLSLDLGFHGAHRPGELIERVDGDVGALANLFSRFSVALLGNALVIVGAVVLILRVDTRIGSGLAALCVVVIVVLVRFRQAGSRAMARAMDARADQSGFLEEQLTSTEDLRSSGATEHALWRFAHMSRRLLDAERHGALRGNLLGVVAGTGFRLGSSAALAGAVWSFHRGDIGVGDVYLVFAATQLLVEPIQQLNRHLGDLQTSTAALGRVRELLRTRSAIAAVGAAEARSLPNGALEVRLRDVDFRYTASDERAVLGGVSFTIPPGRVLGLVGRTGSGKSTIAKLVLRFADPERGAVEIGGTDVRIVTAADLRSRVALVTQDVELLHASARDNLTLFDHGIDDTRILEVLDRLGLARWVSELPDGLDTELRQGSLGLSAGEAQLVAFARVFLRDPDVVILDEATARLDPATEERIEAAIAELLAGRTGILIAHRLQSLRHADDVLVLDDGRVVEHGPRVGLAADPTSRFAHLLTVGLDEDREPTG